MSFLTIIIKKKTKKKLIKLGRREHAKISD